MFAVPCFFRTQESIRELYCHSEAVTFATGGVEGEVHAGMMEAARQLNAALLGVVEKTLRVCTRYKLDLVGFGYALVRMRMRVRLAAALRGNRFACAHAGSLAWTAFPA